MTLGKCSIGPAYWAAAPFSGPIHGARKTGATQHARRLHASTIRSGKVVETGRRCHWRLSGSASDQGTPGDCAVNRGLSTARARCDRGAHHHAESESGGAHRLPAHGLEECGTSCAIVVSLVSCGPPSRQCPADRKIVGYRLGRCTSVLSERLGRRRLDVVAAGLASS